MPLCLPGSLICYSPAGYRIFSPEFNKDSASLINHIRVPALKGQWVMIP